MVGLGLISWVHETGYDRVGDSCRIIAMCDTDPDMAANRAALHDATPYTDFGQLLEDPRVDLVDIAVPHDLHHDVAIAAFEAAKHVVVEKPVATTFADARHMVEAAHAAGRMLAVAENTRYVSAYRVAEGVLAEGVLGDVRTVRSLIAGSEVARIRDPRTWHGKAPYGGVILDSAVHSLYLYRWLFGGVVDVTTHASKALPESEAEDNAVLLGRLRDGGEYHLHVSCTMEIPWTERLEIHGSRGSLVVDQLTDPVVRLFEGGDDIVGSSPGAVPYDPQQWKFTSMFEEIADFVDAAREARSPLVDAADAAYALEAVEAAYRSLEIRDRVAV